MQTLENIYTFHTRNFTVKHTPAPWYIAHHNDIDNIKSIDIRHCCDILHSTPQIHQIACLPENAIANARLISAAPDLLSALEGFIELYEQGQLKLEGDRGSDPLILKSVNAIAKAKGEV
jgi:hypothetical protein